VVEISSESQFKEEYARFTTIPFKPLCDLINNVEDIVGFHILKIKIPIF